MIDDTETIHCDVTEQIATNVISITDGQIYTNANLFKKGYRPAVDSALSVSRVGSSGQFIYFKRLVGTIKNDLTNYRQYVDSSQISDVESDDILLLKLKGIAIECIYQQDQLDGSPIEEIILLLLLYNKGFLNKLTYEQFNNRFLPQVRYLAATELLYVMYIGSVARNRMSKKLERLLSVMLLLIMPSLRSFVINLVFNGLFVTSIPLTTSYSLFLFKRSCGNIYLNYRNQTMDVSRLYLWIPSAALFPLTRMTSLQPPLWQNRQQSTKPIKNDKDRK